MQFAIRGEPLRAVPDLNVDSCIQATVSIALAIRWPPCSQLHCLRLLSALAIKATGGPSEVCLHQTKCHPGTSFAGRHPGKPMLCTRTELCQCHSGCVPECYVTHETAGREPAAGDSAAFPAWLTPVTTMCDSHIAVCSLGIS